MMRDDRLLATYKDGRAHLNAYLDDYAFTVEAILHLLECRWRTADVEFAIALSDTMLAHFEDTDAGGFYFTSDDHETLIVRTKPLMDDASPAGNGVAAHALMRLGHLIGQTRYLDAAHRTLHIARESIKRVPHAHGALLIALEEYLHSPQIVVLRGEPEHTKIWQARANDVYAPGRLCIAIDNAQDSLPGLLNERRARDGAPVTAYVCQGHRCEAPTNDFEQYANLLTASEPMNTPQRRPLTP